jgi:hypothetical protein
MKDLDCVMSCPRDALKFGYSKPPLLSSFDNFTKPDVSWAWTWSQEILGVFVCLGTLLATRQLYGEIPFLLAITLGVIAAWGAVTTLKLCTDANLRVGRFKLKFHGQFNPESIGWVFVVSVAFCLILHSGWIRWHEHNGQKQWALVQSGDFTSIDEVEYHLQTVIAYGLWRPPYADRTLSELYLGLHEYQLAIPHLERLVEIWPDDIKRRDALIDAKNRALRGK